MILYPKVPSSSYVDRPKFRQDVLTLINYGLTKHIYLGDTHGIYGIGKTTSLAKLFYDLKAIDDPNAPNESIALAHCTPIWLSLDAFSVRQTNEKIVDKDSFAAFTQNFEDYKRMLVLLGEQVNEQAYAGLSSALEEQAGEMYETILAVNIQANAGNVDIGMLAKITDSELCGGDIHIELKVENWELILREALKSRISCFNQEFLRRFKPLSKHKRYVLLADDFDSIFGYPLGDWFLDLARQMDNTVTFLARTISESQLNWDKSQLIELTLSPFSVDEVSQYLNRREIYIADLQIQKVYKFSKSGHPLLVSLAGDLLARLDRRGEQDVDDVLDRLLGKQRPVKEETGPATYIDEDELRNRIQRIIDELRDDIRLYDPSLMYGLDIMALARKFDYDLMKFMFANHLLAEADTDPAQIEAMAQRLAHAIIKRMPEYSIVQELEDQVQQESVYRVNYLVREVLEANLLDDEPPEYSQSIHQGLADYYQSREIENMKQEVEYSAMFRLEHADWQKDMIEWLHHLYCLEDRTNASLQLCKLFLESFDWWGWYIGFDFCEELLSRWQRTQPEEDEKVIQLLRDFQTAYPLGYIKDGKADWKIVHKSLANLLAELKLNLPAAQMNSTQRMVSGHLHRYMAEVFRFNDPPNYVKAEEEYNKSLQYFEVIWNKAWIVNYLADLFLDWMSQLEKAGKSGDALEKAKSAGKYTRQANKMALEEANYLDQDHELISQNCRILGSLAFAYQDWAQAFKAFTYCIAHAYIFHFLEDNQDEYSYQFYQDSGEQVLHAIQVLIEQGKMDEAIQACQTLRNFWEQEAPFYADEILSPIPNDFNLNQMLTEDQDGELRRYILPVLPIVGAEGDPIETGIAISQTIADVIADM